MPEPFDEVKVLDWELQLSIYNQLSIYKARLPRLQEIFEAIIKEYPLYAKQYKAYYDALVSVGFTDVQALEIVKTQGYSPR